MQGSFKNLPTTVTVPSTDHKNINREMEDFLTTFMCNSVVRMHDVCQMNTEPLRLPSSEEH